MKISKDGYFKMYPITDKRVVKEVRKCWGEKEINQIFKDMNPTHYCLTFDFFAREGDSLWDERYIICDYDEYEEEE